MFAKFPFRALLALVSVAICCELAVAQQGLTPPKASGFAGVALQQIYREDIGSGYTVSSLNQISLANARASINYYNGGVSSPAAPRIAFNPSPGAALGKPFAGYTPEPTVSPYLNLFREDFEGNSDLNYNTLVQPMLQQQQFNRQVQRQNMELSRRLQAMAAQSDFNPQGSKSQYPTGHQTVFMYYGHYYPTANTRRR